MAAQDVTASAKQGSTQAIATLINKTLQPKGMLASVSKKNAQLSIKIQSQEAPEQDWVMKFLKNGLKKLQPMGILEVQVQASIGGTEPDWEDSFALVETNGSKLSQPVAHKPGKATTTTRTNNSAASANSLFGNQNIERAVIVGATFLLTSGLWLASILAVNGLRQFRSAGAAAEITPEETASSDQGEGQTTSEEVEVAEEPGKAFLVQYLESITTSSASGTLDWCVESEILATSLYSPRSYEILKFSSLEDAVLSTVRIESSNKGGIPIVQNWSFFLQKGATTYERDLRQDGNVDEADKINADNQNWCISSMNE